MRKAIGVDKLVGNRKWKVMTFGASVSTLDTEHQDCPKNTHFDGARVLIHDKGHHYHVASTCEMVCSDRRLVSLTLTDGGSDIRNGHGQEYLPCPSCADVSPELSICIKPRYWTTSAYLPNRVPKCTALT